LNPLGIGVATGEHCQNRVMFKQFLKSNAMQFCQVDACRLGGVNECLAVILLAAKCNSQYICAFISISIFFCKTGIRFKL